MGLARYKQKRDFNKTPEPKGAEAKEGRGKLSFVIQKHDASRLHYDFRLEMDGVLKSWAVPKGVPIEKGEKRLAMEVEDHPLEYGTFEGTIPEGNYGAGTVMLWDRGTYDVLESDPSQGLKAGKLRILLHGKKLKGEWHLVRMRGHDEGDKKAWLLIKSGETHKAIPSRVADRSVASRRTMDEIAGGKSRVWESNRQSRVRVGKMASRSAKPRPRVRAGDDTRRAGVSASQIEKLPAVPPKYVPPMLATLVENPPEGDEWLFEIKWDGYRAVAVKKDRGVELFSRTGRNVTAEFAAIARAVQQVPATSVVLDGEIVALDEQGRPSFQLLQKRNQSQDRETRLYYYVFDLINLEGHSVIETPLRDRKQWLKTLIEHVGDPIRYSAAFQGRSEALMEHARKNRIEGILAKKAASIYEPGRRSRAWLKVKIVCQQEFVIGGYTQPKGARERFGAILAGYYSGERLLFASKVGTGFDSETLETLFAKFQQLRTDTCPFREVDARPASRGGLTPAEKRRCTWLKPELVCEIRFTEWTQDGGLRQPVFLGLRDDKKPREVAREKAEAAS
jgi:bifunctional non-homologous end joining protein LigD